MRLNAVAGNMVRAKSRGWVMDMERGGAIVGIRLEAGCITVAAVIAVAIVGAEAIMEVVLHLGLDGGASSVRKRSSPIWRNT
jgi:hypothetical protein